MYGKESIEINLIHQASIFFLKKMDSLRVPLVKERGRIQGNRGDHDVTGSK
jgi:hypothetical protein